MSQMPHMTALDAVILSNDPGTYVNEDEVQLNATWIHNYYQLGRIGRWLVFARMRFAVWTAGRLRHRIRKLEIKLSRLQCQEKLVQKYENQILPDRRLSVVIKQRLGAK